MTEHQDATLSLKFEVRNFVPKFVPDSSELHRTPLN
jgi:hypothetical protein